VGKSKPSAAGRKGISVIAHQEGGTSILGLPGERRGGGMGEILHAGEKKKLKSFSLDGSGKRGGIRDM